MSKLKLNKLVKESVTWANRKFGERLPTMEDYQEAHDKKLNETLPQFPREWKGLEKAEKNYTKAVLTLGKAIGKVDKKAAKEVVGLYRTLSASMEKYKDLLSKEIMDKLQ